MSDYASIDWAKLAAGKTEEVIKWAVLSSVAKELEEKDDEA